MATNVHPDKIKTDSDNILGVWQANTDFKMKEVTLKVTLACCGLLVLAAALPWTAAAQTTPDGFSVVEKGPHHRVWQKIVAERDAEGVERELVHSYTELADGLHYWDKSQQQWLESSEEIQIVNGVGRALRGQQQVIFSANVNDPQGAIDLSTADGVRLRSSVLALIYFDAVSGKSATVATAKDTAGEVIPPNQVIYRDAFDHLRADVCFTPTTARGWSKTSFSGSNRPARRCWACCARPRAWKC